jgi:hypothetical protein
MKNIIVITLIICFAWSVHAQTGPQNIPNAIFMCYIKYQYDANGNRTNRAYSCEWYNTQQQQSSREAPPSDGLIASIVFPNPSAGIFTVSSNAVLLNASINIKNIQGQTIKQFTYNGISEQYDIRNLPVGQYFIEVIGNQNKEVLKLIKKE